MSYQPLWLRDLVAYSIQAAAMVGVGVIMARLLRLRVPRVRMTYWQGLVALCLFLPLLQPWRPEVLEISGTVMSNVAFDVAVPATAPKVSLAEIVLLLICTGIMVRAAWMMLGMLRLWLYRREAQRIDEVPQAVAEAQRLVSAAPALFISPRLETPATFGYFRPAILFPARFPEMEPSMQKAIALHELLHVERRDWLWNLLEETVLTLLWFHVPLWWAVRSIRLSREQVVDAEAVRRSNARRPYLKALLEMAGQKRLAESLPAALFLRESQLAERVALMMKEVQMSRRQLTISILTAAGVLLIAGASVVWAFPLKTSVQQPTATEASSVAAQPEPGGAGTPLPENPVATEAESAQKSTKVYKIGGKVTAPRLISYSQPPYTRQARKAHLNGMVVLWVVIDAKGHVVRVKESSKPLGEGLDESAIKTVRAWKFTPAMRRGVPVPVKAMVKVAFRIDGKPGEAPQKADPKLDPQHDPQPQVKQPAPQASKEGSQEIKINQAEIQRKIEEAMKQAEIAQKAAAKVDQAKIQKQVEEAMKQLKAAKIATPKINEAEIQRQVEEAMKQLRSAKMTAPKIDQAEIQRQVEEAMKQAKIAREAASKIDQARIQKQIDEAMKQLKAAKIATPKIDQAEIQRQVEEAMKQAKIAQQAAERVNKAEIRREVEQAKTQAEAARKEAEKARKQAEKEGLKGRDQQKEQKPLPPQPPTPPAPPSSKDLPSPPPPPSPQN